MNRNTIEQLKIDTDALINADNYEAIEIEWISAKERILRIYIDFLNNSNLDKKIKIEDCVLVSRKIEKASFLEEQVNGAYKLEVCSPGLDRPLRYLKHFNQWVGSSVQIQLNKIQEEKRKFQGKIDRVDMDSNSINIMQHNESMVAIPLENIKKANIIHNWS